MSRAMVIWEECKAPFRVKHSRAIEFGVETIVNVRGQPFSECPVRIRFWRHQSEYCAQPDACDCRLSCKTAGKAQDKSARSMVKSREQDLLRCSCSENNTAAAARHVNQPATSHVTKISDRVFASAAAEGGMQRR